MKPVYPTTALIWSATVVPTNGQDPVSFHVAADFVGAALSKVQRFVHSEQGWRPHKGNSRVTLKRVTLAALLASGSVAVGEAAGVAVLQGERDTLKRLDALQRELGAFQRSLEGPSPSEVWEALQREVAALAS